MSHTLELRNLFEPLFSLAIGVAVIVALSAIIAWRLPIAAWKRTIWQVCTLSVAFLLIGECTGVVSGVTNWSCGWLAASAPSAAVSEIEDVVSADPRIRGLELSDVTGLEAELNSSPSEQQIEDIESNLRRAAATTAAPPLGPSTTSLGQGDRWGAWLWLMGTGALLSRLFVGRLLLEWFRGRHRATNDVALHKRVQAIARRLGMKRRVRIIVVPGLSGPISMGMLRPTIGLPERFTEQFDRQQQEAMLAHELGHLVAHDSAWHALADFVAATLWWHPLVWWSRRELRSASEWAADEASLALPGGAESLAACLVEFGQQVIRRRPVGWTGIEGNGFRSSLGRRVERLLRMSDRPWSRPRWVSSSLMIVFGPTVMVTVALVSTSWSRPPETSQGETMFQSIRQSWRQSLAALMFLGMAGSSDDSIAPAAEDPFAPAVAQGDTKPDRQSIKEEDDDDDDKESVKGKKDDDDRRDTKPGKKEDDEKKPAKGKGKGDDDSLDDLRARLKQLEAENAKLRNAVQEKEAAGGYKKAVENKFIDKLPPIKSTKPIDPHAQKGGEKQADEQQQILAKLKAVQEQIGQLQKEGRKEEAEKLTHAAQDLQHMLTGQQAKHGKESPKEHSSIAERVEQLKREIEENARAGRKEQAEALRHELEKTIDHAQHMQRKGFIKADPKHGPEAPQELMGIIKELSGQVQQLRAEVEELRRIVKDRGDDRKK